MKKAKRCEDCVAWDFIGKDFGLCKKHAPSPAILSGVNKEGREVVNPQGLAILVWPSTGKDDWCLEGEEVPHKSCEKLDVMNRLKELEVG